jgi:hypothetical protein
MLKLAVPAFLFKGGDVTSASAYRPFYRLRLCKSRLNRVDLFIIELPPSLQYGNPTQVASPLRGTMPVIPTVVHPHCEDIPTAVSSPPSGTMPGYIRTCTWPSLSLTRRTRTCSLVILTTVLTIYFFFFINRLRVTLLYITLCNTLSVHVIAFVNL